jgi:hypothetical protein
MVISASHVIVVALVAIVGWVAVKWLFQKDEAIEDRRRSAAKLAAALQAYGLRKLPELLIDYSVGDYSGMAVRIKQATEMLMSGEASIAAEFDQVFDRVLAQKLMTEAGRALIAAKLSDAVKPSDPVSVKVAPVAKVQ